MSYVIGVAAMLVLGCVYVGLGLADRGRKGCGGCALRDAAGDCGACPQDDGARADGTGRANDTDARWQP